MEPVSLKLFAVTVFYPFDVLFFFNSLADVDDDDDDGLSAATVGIIVAVVVVLVIVLLVLGLCVYKLKKDGKDVNAKNMKEVTANAGKNVKSKMVTVTVNAYNSAYNAKDGHVIMKSGQLESDSSAVNPGYVEG